MARNWVHPWIKLVETAAFGEGVYTGVRKIIPRLTFKLPYPCQGLVYSDLMYRGSKEAQLNRNYWNLESIEAGRNKLLERSGKPHSSVTISMNAASKQSISQGFCMIALVLTVTNEMRADMYYRSTEVIQKFAADLVFLSDRLPQIFKGLPKPDHVQFTFSNLYVSAMFLPIFLRFHPDPVGFFEALKISDPRFYKTCQSAVLKYFQKEHNYTYRTRVNLFEYWRKHLGKQEKLYEFLKSN